MTPLHIVGIVVTLIAIVGLSVYSGRKVKNAADFATGGGKTGSVIVAGAIMGTLVGGSSTVGTAQLAYSYGLSAWWFTLGGGIACLVLALGFVKPLRKTGASTLVGIMSSEYGQTSGILASVLSSIGTFINIISQMLAATAVIAVMLPKLGTVPALMCAAALMALYVIVGGVQSAGAVGVLKLVLLYVAMIGSGIIVLVLTKGWTPLVNEIHAVEAKAIASGTAVNYFSLFARGFGTDAGAGLSLVFGVLTTQTYAQAVLSGKSDRASRKGALISAIMIPPIGIGGILVGLFMRVHFPPEMRILASKNALTQFILDYMPAPLAGVVLATLLIAVVGTGAGLSLGISTIIGNDIVKKVTRKIDDPIKNLLFSRVCIIVVLLAAVSLSTGALGDVILNFAFMSMGLRGAVVFVPLVCALWFRGRIDKKFVITSIIVSPLCVLLFGVTKWVAFDSLFVGIAAGIVICAIGLMVGKKPAQELKP
ncbi:MAG: sodium:solute symporter family protein [Oscillospiraceae bacterium]|jgi:SSS family solute:Na+ symporter|nr:sodium:solute symporter family protein [Oscillospiraceae bacterium]